MVERRRVVHDRRRLLLEAGHPMSSRVLIASLASLLVACGDEIATPTAGADARRYTLALIGDPSIPGRSARCRHCSRPAKTALSPARGFISPFSTAIRRAPGS